MWSRIVSFFSGIGSNNNEFKTCVDSRLGKLTCEFDRKKDEFFFWNAEINTINKDKSPTDITIDGDMTSPYSTALEIAHKVIDSISNITYDVQQELNAKFSEENIDLSKGYTLDDITVYMDNEVEYELEYFSDGKEVMVSVSFKDNKITELDLY